MPYLALYIICLLLVLIFLLSIPHRRIKIYRGIITRLDKVEHDFRRSTKPWEKTPGFPEFIPFFNIYLTLFNRKIKDKKIKSMKLYILGRKNKYFMGKKEYFMVE
jgi:hypothetical protein